MSERRIRLFRTDLPSDDGQVWPGMIIEAEGT